MGLTTLPPSSVDFHEIWEPQYPGTRIGLSRPVMELLYLYLYIYIYIYTGCFTTLGHKYRR